MGSHRTLSLFRPLVVAGLATCLLASAVPAVPAASPDNMLHLGAARLDPPTLLALGVQLPVTGDDDHDARVAVRYRPSGTTTWKPALSLFRVHPADVVGRVVPDQFAGSIFDLTPATAYDLELHATDPDGPVDQTVVLSASTRAVPASEPQHPASKSVQDAAALQAALSAAQPGDVINLAPGNYRGQFVITASGTAADPIVIRGASQDTAVLDGGGCSGCNVIEVYGSYVHIERLTIIHGERGIRFQGAGAEANVLRRVHVSDVRLGVGSKADQRDFYLCDNVLEGRLQWPKTYADDNGQHSDDDGIHIEGAGHVVCHNQLSGFGDAMKIGSAGARADDFYGNEVLSAYDNGLEFDGAEGNVRAFRNRFTNTYATLSFQPVYGGPVYAIRNVVVNVANEQMKFHGLGTTPPQEPNGVFVYNNTFVSPDRALNLQTSATSHHFVIANNLFVGPETAGSRVVEWTGGIDDGTFDFNGWRPDGVFDFDAVGQWSSFAAMKSGGDLESHGVLLTSPVFASGLVAPSSARVTMLPPDATLSSASNAIDKGLVLPNVNDRFNAGAPDLGALERGCPLLLFGVRPSGIDETNEPFGCGGPSVVTPSTVSVQTTALTLKDGAPKARKVTFKSSTKSDPIVNRVVPPAPGTTGDPTIGGGTLTVYNAAGSGEKVVVTLPASDWSSSSRGYRFKGADPNGPISTIDVRANQVNISGGKANWGYTLNEAAQGRVAMRLTLGTGIEWCAAAPAKVSGKPPSTAANDRVNLFVAAPKSPPPSTCPPVP